MSFVVANTEFVSGAAGNLARLGSMISAANSAAAPGAVAQPLIAAFAAALRQLGAHVEAGVFGAHMQVELVNDGPVTVMLEG